MSVTINTLTLPTLTAQPFGYEGEARTGLTARTITVSGLLTPSQWQSLLTLYNTWRNTRVTDPDTLSSASIGTTVTVSCSANGVTVTNLPCWFTDPPTGPQTGAYIAATATLVDAEQALAVLLRTQEKSRQNSEANLPNLGTVTLGNAVVTLTRPMQTRRDGPDVGLTATGVSYVTGPLAAHAVRAIEGYISSGTYADLLSWYDSTIGTLPAAGSWFPVTAPQATAEVIITGGAKATRYTVSLTALQIL